MQNKNKLSLALFYIVSGVLIGGGAILPGVSGGVLCVVFGVYRPLMELLSHPKRSIPKYWRMFLFVFIGVALGFVGVAKVVGNLFERYEIQMLCLFIGLILGTVPMLLKTAKADGKTTRQDTSALVIAFAALMALLLILRMGNKASLPLNPATAFISGIIWGFSLVIPGLSSSSLLIFLGLYDKIMLQVGNLNWSVVIPLMLGIAIVAVLFASLVDRLFEKHHSIASHAVVGLVLASTVSIIPAFADVKMLFVGIALAAVGFLAAMQLDKWQATVKRD
ncbi:MAG: DUF368 domain-containing protein [Eubacteriales bacterium]|nr:DUF368 domain-containing protein [Eubacteriales bacterium]